MYANTKSGQYALLMGLAGSIRRLARVEDSVHALASYVGDRAVAASTDGLDSEAGPGIGDRESLLLLAVEFEAAATRILQRSPEMRRVRSKSRRHGRRDVSRETGAEEGPPTERFPTAFDGALEDD